MKLNAALFLGVVASIAVAGEPAEASNQQFTEHAIDTARKAGFVGCDTAIKDFNVFARGDEFQVVVTTFDNPDVMSMTTTFGDKGDSVLSKALFVKQGDQCLYQQTAVVTANQTCEVYLAGMPSFKKVKESTDFVWAESDGGVLLVLSPVANQCVATYTVSAVK